MSQTSSSESSPESPKSPKRERSSSPVDRSPQDNDRSNGYADSQSPRGTQSSGGSDDDEDVPLSQKVKRESSSPKRKYKEDSDNDSEEDVPLAKKKKVKSGKKNGVKREKNDDDYDDEASVKSESEPSDDDDSGSEYGEKKKGKKKSKKSKAKNGSASKSSKKKRKHESEDDDDEYSDDEYTDSKKKKSKKDKKKDSKKSKSGSSQSSKRSKSSQSSSPEKSPKKKVKEEDQEHIWKWWEELDDYNPDQKWRTLEHKGPVFAPPYVPLPKGVNFVYEKKPMKLCLEAEEVATFYGKMIDHDYTQKDIFNKNFFKDWKRFMTEDEKKKIESLSKCDFTQINDYFKEQSEIRKNMSKEDKKKLKEENERITEEYGYCVVDGHKQKIGNFRIEPPGLFRGRGDHPKMGKVKRRVEAEDIIINIGKKAKVPDPPKGHKWKEVRHDNTVSWLVSWTENIMGNVKYIMLNPSSKLKSMKDWQKYEKARELHKVIERIREDYIEDWKAREMVKRQRAVALYFIDRLALRAGNEKDDSEAADTVGCCSLRVEHIKLYDELNGKKYVAEFDFLGKDSIRYFNQVPVEKQVFKNLRIFMENKKRGDDLFDRLTTQTLNKYLNELMDGLTAKCFRTYNASITLQRELDKLMKELKKESKGEITPAEKVLAYNRANRSVALLCNHQRTVPKGFEKQMDGLREKIQAKKDAIKDAKKELKKASRGDEEKIKKRIKTLKEQLGKLKVQETDKEENKQIALGTSKLNYLDPRITVAWCKKYDVPLEKVYTKTHREKFRWAIEMATADYRFDK